MQCIASSLTSKDEIPEAFIRPESERPSTTTYHGSVPIIDLNYPNHEQMAQNIANAAREWGIFQLVNHGIPVELLNRLQEVGREFFDLPQQEKEIYAVDPKAKNMEGYGTMLQKQPQGKMAWGDFFFHNIWPPSCINYDIWPKNPSSYRQVNEEYAKHLVKIVDEVMGSLSVGLGLEEKVLKEKLGGEDVEFLLKINYYPPCPRPDLALGVVAHTDMSGLTVLVPNNVSGLQVFKDDLWMDVIYIPNSLIINMGDQIEILSNGQYKSVLHRTKVNKEKVRMSWPVFCCPPGEKLVGPLPELVNDTNPAKFKTKKYMDYSYCKLNKLPQ